VHIDHPDRLGTRVITNSRDRSINKQVTLPFGTLIPGESSNPTNPIFTSFDRSLVVGLDYAINRQYDPGLRFTQPDQADIAAVSLGYPRSFNPYTYVRSDPVNKVDVSGGECVPLSSWNPFSAYTCDGGIQLKENVTIAKFKQDVDDARPPLQFMIWAMPNWVPSRLGSPGNGVAGDLGQRTNQALDNIVANGQETPANPSDAVPIKTRQVRTLV